MELVGPVCTREQAGSPVLGIRIEERHRNAAGAAHGGCLATLADFALGMAIRADSDGEAKPVTVSLTTDFLGPVNVGDWVEAHTEVERLGGKLAFADCSLKVEDREAVRARAVFALLD
jgi:uncharacterized protein (TIGR00369 family)